MKSVTSTNSLALEAVQEGAGHGTIFVADYQTHGRGRQGHTWTSDEGLNLTFSIILNLPVSKNTIGITPLAACLGIADALNDVVTPNKLEFKWPNDILLNGRKICGMLLQTSNQSVGKIVLGIGINVNQTVFSEDLEKHATSLLLSTGQSIDRASLMASILLHLEKRFELLSDELSIIRNLYTEKLIWLGQHCKIIGMNKEVNGILLGIAESGALLLKTRTGIQTIYAGNVSIRVANH